MRVVVSGVSVGDNYERPGWSAARWSPCRQPRCCSVSTAKAVHTVLALPVFAWEVSFAIWLIAKGFKPSTITATSSPEVEGHTPLPLG